MDPKLQNIELSAELRQSFSTCVHCMSLRFQGNYPGWLSFQEIEKYIGSAITLWSKRHCFCVPQVVFQAQTTICLILEKEWWNLWKEKGGEKEIWSVLQCCSDVLVKRYGRLIRQEYNAKEISSSCQTTLSNGPDLVDT